MQARRVAIVVLENGQTLDAVGPAEVLAGATEALRRAGTPDPGYALEIVGPTRGAVRMESGLSLVAERARSELAGGPPIDTLVIAGGRGTNEAARDPVQIAAVRAAAGHSRRVTSVCTGAFVLAAAGLLDGRAATTHWAFCDALARDWPAVHVERAPIYVRAGDVWTSAGVTAGIDLALALVEEDLGRELALMVARWLVVFVRRSGGQSQFSAQLAVQGSDRAPVRELQAWIALHPEAALAVPDLARRAGMSVRNFSRVFRTSVGVAPATYVENVRIETARRLLESTGLSSRRRAEASGFRTPEALRRSFARRIGLSPREYRARFGERPEHP